jgi:hypothetical protein
MFERKFETTRNKMNVKISFFTTQNCIVPYGLVVRIPAFHAGGPGSIPGVGTLIF